MRATSLFATSHKLDLPLGTPYANSYGFENMPHLYLPYCVGTVADGGLLITESGRVEEKSWEPARARLEAARHLAGLIGGALWIGTGENGSRLRQQNLIFLHDRQQNFPAFHDIASHVSQRWRSQDLSIAEVIRRLEERRSAAEVEAVAWKLVAEAAAK